MSEDLASRSSFGGGATFLEWEIDRFQQSLITVILKGGMISYVRSHTDQTPPPPWPATKAFVSLLAEARQAHQDVADGTFKV